MQSCNKRLIENLNYLKLKTILENYQTAAQEAAKNADAYIDFLDQLIAGEANQRYQTMVERRIKQARLPLIKTLDQFQWTHPKKINQQQVKHLFRLHFIENKENVIFLGTAGLGKTHLAIALTHHACLSGHTALFATAIDIANELGAAQKTGQLVQAMKKYIKPSILVIDELGYLAIDNHGADLLFQVISHRYEKGSIILTTNRHFKSWPTIFNNDSMITSAILDRLLHHSEVIVIEGKSYRMKDRNDS
jgi:DNA replication protein DnaC